MAIVHKFETIAAMRQLRDPSPDPIEGLSTVGVEVATKQAESNIERN
jgi:hypothetical protein